MAGRGALIWLVGFTVAGCFAQPTPSEGPSRFTALNRMSILQDPNTPDQFEVFRLAGAGPVDVWCAAGDYVTRGRGMATNTRIYLVAPFGPSAFGTGSPSAVFSVSPEDELLQAANLIPETDYSLSINRVGGNWRAAHVTQNCSPLLFPFSTIAD